MHQRPRARCANAPAAVAIEGGGNAYGTAPYLTVREHEAGQEVLIFSARLPGLVQRYRRSSSQTAPADR